MDCQRLRSEEPRNPAVVAELARLLRAVGLEPVHSLQEGVDWLAREAAGEPRWAAVPFANVTYATLA